MTDAQVFAWILLSVPEHGGNLQDLIAMADGINHAIPTHKELQRGLGWLRHKGLVQKDGRNFSLTQDGSLLVARYSNPGQTMMNTWNLVTIELAALIDGEAPHDDIAIDEEKRAYSAYKRDFSERLRKLVRGDT